MIFMAVPLCLLFEIAVLIARVHDKRKAAREAAESFAHLPDDVASPLDTTPSEVEPAEPLDRSYDPRGRP
jgi:sec-independent protein translocase protein TatC